MSAECERGEPGVPAQLVSADISGGPAADVFARLGVPAGLAEELRRHVRRPVHAYLLLGPHGRTAARAFAAALLCPTGGCGRCRSCRAVVDGHHPDATILARAGPTWRIEEVRGLLDLAVRAPAAGGRVVLVLPDAHLLGAVAPAILKTLEEPPATTVLVLVADSVPPGLVTVASRCVRIVEPTARTGPVDGLPAARLAASLSADSPVVSRRLQEDPRVAAAADFWFRLPGELGPEGRLVARLLDEAIAHLDALGDAVTAARSAVEAGPAAAARDGGPDRPAGGCEDVPGGEGRAEESPVRGSPVGGSSAEEGSADAGSAEEASRLRRRVRQEVLEAALGLLGSSLAARLPTAPAPEAIDRLTRLGAAWRRNPNERIQLAALIVALADAVSARSSPHRPAASAGGRRAR